MNPLPFLASVSMLGSGLFAIVQGDPVGAVGGLGGLTLSAYILFEVRSLRRDVTELQKRRK